MDSELKVFLLIALAVVVAILFPVTCVCFSIPTGSVGVMYSFGAINDQTLQPGGPYLVLPWKSVHRINLQTKRNEEEMTIPTKGGLPVKVKGVLLYRVDPAKLTTLLAAVGEEYEKVLVDPYFKNAMNDVGAEYAPEALYTDARTEVERKITAHLNKDLAPQGFIVEQVMIQEPHLPESVKSRIEAKASAEQDALRMAYVFKQKEQEGLTNKRQKELEAESKVIEAKGIADAQAIIKKDLDSNYLRYLWIQALKENHGATVYVPTGSDGMPLFKEMHPAGK